MSDLTDHLWERFGSLDLGDVPDGPREVAEQCVLDWFGVARAGATEPLADILRSTHAGSEGPCTVLGGARADEERAALVNGAIGHALDFDDTSPLMGGHPTVPVLPAALAVVEATGRTGADLLTAYVVGHEVQARIGAAIGVDHYRRGWHQTATVGVFGAAAAVATLAAHRHSQFPGSGQHVDVSIIEPMLNSIHQFLLTIDSQSLQTEKFGRIKFVLLKKIIDDLEIGERHGTGVS